MVEGGNAVSNLGITVLLCGRRGTLGLGGARPWLALQTRPALALPRDAGEARAPREPRAGAVLRSYIIVSSFSGAAASGLEQAL